MNKVLLVSFIGVLCISLSLQQVVKVKIDEIKMADVQLMDALNKMRVNEGLPPIVPDQQTMAIAQNEAERLARLRRVELPMFTIGKNYVGVSYRLEGRNGMSFIGTKMCHNNINKDRDTKIYDINVDCDDPRTDSKVFIRTAAGQAVGADQAIYGVRLFLKN